MVSESERIELETQSSIIGKDKGLSMHIVSLVDAVKHCQNNAPIYISESLSRLDDLIDENRITKEEKKFMKDRIFGYANRFRRDCLCSFRLSK